VSSHNLKHALQHATYHNIHARHPIPAQLVFDAVQGKTSVYKEYRDKPNDFPRTFFEIGWDVVDVNFVRSKIEDGTDNFIEFTLARSSERAFKKL